MAVKRDKSGAVKLSWWRKIKSWWLGRQLRKGKVPRGRTGKMTSAEAIDILGATHRGVLPEICGLLSVKVLRGGGTIEDHGLVCVKKVTTAFRDYLVSSLQDSTTYPLDIFKYHASGTDATAEANTQTALLAEVATRVAGSQAQGASANIYKTIATIPYTATLAITEHGVLSAATTGTLLDRSVFTAVNVVSGDSIQFTYELTTNAEA